MFELFAGPDHATILDEYTGVVGRPIVPPDWAFLHWRWRDELHLGAPAMLDGAPVNAELADDVLMYDALGIPPGVYLFDRPVLAGELRLRAAGNGTRSGCRTPTRCCSRSSGAAIT